MCSESDSIIRNTKRKTMDLKDRKWLDTKDHHSVQTSEKALIHEQPEKVGWFKKLLAWISKGAAKPNTGTSCPT